MTLCPGQGTFAGSPDVEDVAAQMASVILDRLRGEAGEHHLQVGGPDSSLGVAGASSEQSTGSVAQGSGSR